MSSHRQLPTNPSLPIKVSQSPKGRRPTPQTSQPAAPMPSDNTLPNRSMCVPPLSLIKTLPTLLVHRIPQHRHPPHALHQKISPSPTTTPPESAHTPPPSTGHKPQPAVQDSKSAAPLRSRTAHSPTPSNPTPNPMPARKYDDLSKPDLIRLLEARARRDATRFGLVWEANEIERDNALNADFVALDLDPSLSCPSSPSPSTLGEGRGEGHFNGLEKPHHRRRQLRRSPLPPHDLRRPC